jgi:hypothetical protein
MHINRSGYALILTLIMSALLLTLAGLFAKMIFNSMGGGDNTYRSFQVFYLAEAGIEKGKTELNHNPNWYTDLSHGSEDDTDWLINAAVGQSYNLGGGSFKIIREQGKMLLYAVGTKGKGICIQKISFDLFPFKEKKWETI